MISSMLGNVFVSNSGKKVKANSQATKSFQITIVVIFLRPLQTTESRTGSCCRPCRGVLLYDLIHPYF